ncbi:hypothetical protein ONS95_008093 [Cadophora gregata]|uniref:uncharacterized protein n=1 Tax=Cadophora gregata TaxID=51156 RepID=UPI0026DB8F2A|nr:uncharacterized protein ONS95_008093 [Cadophora gregata]KAK0119239.1 hypothetical protein ONS96_012300 [Cadophora gregata f. sp. sojae]KAK0126496.1 hypothetical protein ONS95_008093 [Cadophora gregata]
MMNPPPAKSPQPLISMQSNTIVSPSVPTPLPASPSGQQATLSLNPAQSPPTLPPIPFAPLESAKEVEVLKPTPLATSTAGSKASVDAAIIAGAETRTPAVSSSPPLSAITIASAAIGGVIIVTLIIVVSVITMRWRAAKKKQERENQENSAGNEDNGSTRGSVSDKADDSDTGGSSGLQVTEGSSQSSSAGHGSQPTNRGMVEVGGPADFVAMARTRQVTSPTQYGETGLIPMQREISTPQRPIRERDVERTAGLPIISNATENPFNRRISLSPFDSPFDDIRDNDVLDSPMKVYRNQRGSEWSVATLTTNHDGTLRANERGRGMDALDREAEMIRGRFPGATGPDLGRISTDDSRVRKPPMTETYNGMRVPVAGLERRISRNSLSTVDSDTYQKLMYDVQSQPF